MKPEQLTELYSKLTPEELGNLAINAITRFDEKELDLIIDSVERNTYECSHVDYINRLRSFERLALTYGVQFWKIHALATLALKHHNHGLDGYISEPKKQATQLSNSFLISMASMEIALIRVCEQSQIDINAVKWLAECEDNDIFMPVTLDMATDEQITVYTALFNAAVNIHAENSICTP